ncbi:MAG: tetratricopeptide repeat protein [Vicinamibacterales bacterium]
MTRQLLAASIAVALVSSVAAQEMRFFYPAPPASAVAVSKDQSYGALQMDVYRPANAAGKTLPVLVFFNIASGAQRSNFFYKPWAEIAASRDLVAILPDLRDDSFEKDFDALIAHLTANASSLGIDRDRIALYAGSGNVYRALPLVQTPRQTVVKAAVMYYGSAQVSEFRRDLPILMVRAGLDRPPVNRAIADLATLAANQNAPLTLLNYAGGHHAFEIVDDEDATRDVIDTTIEFVKRTTAPTYQASLRRALPEATAAAHVASGNFAAAAASYAELVKARPDDARMRLSYGEALLGASQFAEACTELEKLKGKGLGARDLGVPAARACMQKGDAQAALAWLKSIPQRYLPRSLEQDPIFAPIQNRPEFKALFQTGG